MSRLRHEMEKRGMSKLMRENRGLSQGRRQIANPDNRKLAKSKRDKGE